MKWFAAAMGMLLAGCAPQTHSFVVDVTDADKPVSKAVTTICDEPPKQLRRAGNWFVGRLIVGCEGSGGVRLTHPDGTTTDCPSGYVTFTDDWRMFELRGRSCVMKWAGEA